MGLIPKQYQGDRSLYPSDAVLYHGTLIPPDRIKDMFSKVFDDREREMTDEVVCLQAFSELFPGSKFLTEKQRKWLRDYDNIGRSR